MSLKPKPSEPRRKLIVNEVASPKWPKFRTNAELALINFNKSW